MIFAEIYRNKNGKIKGFCVKGHAGFSEHGDDIVCSAVSMLVINTINSINQLTDDYADVDVYDEEDGKIICNFPEELGKDAEMLAKSMVLGLESTQYQYGKYIKLTEVLQND